MRPRQFDTCSIEGVFTEKHPKDKKMKLLFIFVSFTLVLTSLTSKLQDMPDSALAEPLQLLLEVF